MHLVYFEVIVHIYILLLKNNIELNFITKLFIINIKKQ